MEDIKTLASEDAVSVNQFLIQAAAEKVAALKARGYLASRAAQAVPGEFSRVLAKAGAPVALPGDELPESCG